MTNKLENAFEAKGKGQRPHDSLSLFMLWCQYLNLRKAAKMFVLIELLFSFKVILVWSAGVLEIQPSNTFSANADRNITI